MNKKRGTLFAIYVFIVMLIVLIFSSRFIDYGDFSVVKPEDGIEYEFVSVNGINLHVATAGPKDGEPVILLHGYPDAHFGWRDQIVALADASFRVDGSKVIQVIMVEASGESGDIGLDSIFQLNMPNRYLEPVAALKVCVL